MPRPTKSKKGAASSMVVGSATRNIPLRLGVRPVMAQGAAERKAARKGTTKKHGRLQLVGRPSRK